jgi:FlaA1/EpsC-like NDP-sugar epimerase
MKDTYGKPNGDPRADGASQAASPPLATEEESHRTGHSHAPLIGVRAAMGLRRVGLGLVHMVLFAFVYWLAFNLRFDFRLRGVDYQGIEYNYFPLLCWTLPWIVAVTLTVFHFSGYFRRWWRHVTFADLVVLGRSSVLSLLAIGFLNYFFVEPNTRIPRGVLILNCAFTILILGVFRSSWRLFREHVRPAFQPKEGQRTVIVGTDHGTAVLAHQIQSQPQLPYQIEGLLATNGRDDAIRLGHFPVLGHVNNVKAVAAAWKITDVLVTASVLPGKQLRQLMNACREAGLNLKIIPNLEDRINGDARIPMRSIEINDLLRREPVELDSAAIGRLIEGTTVMVTGAGGSIGSEICRQILKYNPKTLLLVGRGENRIFGVERELRPMSKSTTLYPRIADIADVPRMRMLFEEFRPEVVFHAAAHKHVPLMESNVGEAIKNNVGGTRCVADLASEFGTRSFVLISTDKAVRPRNVMGATKQLAEQYVLALSEGSGTRFSVVRFGNVLGSAGSVVPIFEEQIRHGGPITVTDPRMTRFFMTIPEASQLVLQAATMGRGGEIYVLDMGEPVRIVDLARDMIRLAGLPEDSIEIVFTGTRPGEKLYEELYSDEEESLPTTHPKLRAAYPRPVTLPEVRQAIAELERYVHEPEEIIRQKLQAVVPELGRPDAHEPSEKTPHLVV